LFRQGMVTLLLCGCVLAQTKGPERRVEGNIIRSERDPRVQIVLPTPVQYVGADRWILYGMADCELHAFVQADAEKTVQRLYWVQFESYLPTRPELRHKYNSPRHAEIGGMDFYVDTWVKKSSSDVTPDSDEEHIHSLIEAKGYRIPGGMMSVRLVHLLDEQKRKELMVIYSEDVSATGLSAEDLRKGGRAYDRWPGIEAKLIERAERAIKVETIAHP
jgi:hypothetical protein